MNTTEAMNINLTNKQYNSLKLVQVEDNDLSPKLNMSETAISEKANLSYDRIAEGSIYYIEFSDMGILREARRNENDKMLFISKDGDADISAMDAVKKARYVGKIIGKIDMFGAAK